MNCLSSTSEVGLTTATSVAQTHLWFGSYFCIVLWCFEGRVKTTIPKHMRLNIVFISRKGREHLFSTSLGQLLLPLWLYWTSSFTSIYFQTYSGYLEFSMILCRARFKFFSLAITELPQQTLMPCPCWHLHRHYLWFNYAQWQYADPRLLSAVWDRPFGAYIMCFHPCTSFLNFPQCKLSMPIFVFLVQSPVIIFFILNSNHLILITYISSFGKWSMSV